MRLKTPRVPALADSEWNDEQRELLADQKMDGRVLNIMRTFGHNPDATRAFLAYGNYILSKRNSLPRREREIAILRVGFLCRSGYEWAQHEWIGAKAGLTPPEIARIKQGASAQGWSAADRAILTATDELHHDQFITTPSWQALLQHFSRDQCANLVLTVGQYTQVSMLLNTLGVQLDEGLTLDPDLTRFEA